MNEIILHQSRDIKKAPVGPDSIPMKAARLVYKLKKRGNASDHEVFSVLDLARHWIMGDDLACVLLKYTSRRRALPSSDVFHQTFRALA